MNRIYFILIFIFAYCTVVSAEEKEVPIRCTGDSVTYHREEDTIYASGNVEISYQNNYIRCDTVKVNTKTKEVTAEGHVISSDGKNFFTGNKVYYNMNTGKGNADGIACKWDPWFASGEKGERISKDLYYIKDAYVTTCDYEKPHYKIRAKDVYIYPNDKIVAKNIIFYWGDMPLFYWPYFKKSLKDRRNPWTIIPGQDTKFGKYLLLGYAMWFENFFGGSFEPTLRLDMYEKRGIGLGLYGKYKFTDKIRTLLRSYYINDKAYEDNNGVKRHKKRGRLSMDWIQKLTEDTRAVVDLNLQSDKTIIYDFFRDEFQDEIQSENYIDVSKTTPWYQLSGTLKKRFYGYYTDMEKLPEVNLNLLEFQLGETSLFYKASGTAGYLRQLFANDIDADDYSSGRFDTVQQLQYPRKYFGWLNIIPRIGTRQTYFTKSAKWVPYNEIVTTTDASGNQVQMTVQKEKKVETDKGRLRSVYFAGAEFTTKISRIFYVDNDFWQIHQLRHVIEPRVNYCYKHPPTVLERDLLNFGDVETKENYFDLGLRNKLQTRRSGPAWDLIDLWFGTRYYPEQYFYTPEKKKSFSTIAGDLKVWPFDWWKINSTADFDQYAKQVNRFDIENFFYYSDIFSFGLGYRYLHDSDKLWSSEVNYSLNSNWAIHMAHRFEFDSGQLQEQEYVLYRDLHCWRVAFSFREFEQTDEKRYFFVLSPKAFPDIPVTFGTTFFGQQDTAKVDFDID